MNVDDILVCPSCRGPLSPPKANEYKCTSCDVEHISQDGVPVFLRWDSKIIADEADRAEFWNTGWEKRNAHLLSKDRDAILKERLDYQDYLLKEGYPSVTDLSPDDLKDKLFLNIGCGGGYEGLLFAGYGTRYIGVDFSHNAASFTKKLIDKAGFNGTTFQAEAEALPFQNDSVDFVYSSGVLHHTPNTEQALKEVYRVLKPGGTAMIGLYATYSVMFMWYRLHAVVGGNFSKKSVDDWMNANTEGDWQTGDQENHWTKTYSKPEFIGMMKRAEFNEVRIKQTPQQIKTIPLVGKVINALFPAAVGDLRVGPFGGMLVATTIKN
jgi:LSD1 subclass zinc finger protein